MAKSKPLYIRVAQLKSFENFSDHLKSIGAEIPIKEHLSQPSDSSLGAPIQLASGQTIGNRFCILPMEGWDGTPDGLPTAHTKRRWKNFAISGAKLLWGCEAVAVRPDGRANPNQLLINEANLEAFKALYADVISDHEAEFGSSDDLMVGLQLTHSGRFAVPDPDWKRQPKILYHHSILDQKFNIPADSPVMSDDDIDELVEDFVKAAALAKAAGFHFVDVKHCHGYLGHEFLSAKERGGKYGGSLRNRLHFLESIVKGIKETSNIAVAVRLSIFDWIPFKKNQDGIGIPYSDKQEYQEAFGGDGTGLGDDFTEVFELLRFFEDLGIELICTTAGSPYYVPHIQRPAIFPPSDGYLPPEDPLVGVARQIHATHVIKQAFPNLIFVGSAYSYLQEWLPNVAEAVVDANMADFVGLGRMVLSYPDMPVDILQGNPMQRKKLCRTFSDCTTAPRNKLVSGCYPLDPYYKKLPESKELKEFKKLY
jgi:2,4-dienoyl-CoA reductase-like NADH-dependent reductase (Old Yellow Enzyme family)